jgi:hypothetical protein
MIPLLLSLAAIGHSQQGILECPIHVGTADISKTWKIENTTCTFILAAGVTQVDAISISRFTAPHVAGWIEINGQRMTEDIAVTPHVEPFAILPSWSTHSNSSVPINNNTVTVYAPETSYVSFGMAESFWLVMGEVVRDAYDAREDVYDVPAAVMWAAHGTAFVVCLAIATTQYSSWIEVALLAWIAVCAFADLGVWTAWALSLTDGHGGTGLAVVTIMRVLLLAYLAYTVVDTPSRHRWYASSEDKYRYGGGAVLLAYVAGTLMWGYPGLGDYPKLVCALYVATVAAVTWLHPFLPLSVLITLFSIVLNVGAGALAPLCMWWSHAKRRRTTARSWSHGAVHAPRLDIVHIVGVIYFIYTVSVIASIAHPGMRKWTLVTVISLHLVGLASSPADAHELVKDVDYLPMYYAVDLVQVLILYLLLKGESIDVFAITVVLAGCVLCFLKLKQSLEPSGGK